MQPETPKALDLLFGTFISIFTEKVVVIMAVFEVFIALNLVSSQQSKWMCFLLFEFLAALLDFLP